MNLFIITAIVLFIYFVVFFIIGQIIKNNSIVDFGWGLGFIVVVITGLIFSENITFSAILISVLVVIWGTRLSLHIARRNFGKPEDFRYVEMRKKWGAHPYIKAFINVYMIQAIFMYIRDTS